MKYLGYLKRLPGESNGDWDLRVIYKRRELKRLLDSEIEVVVAETDTKAYFYQKEKPK